MIAHAIGVGSLIVAALLRASKTVSGVHAYGFFMRGPLTHFSCMEAVFKNKSFKRDLSLNQVMATFFAENTPETSHLFFFKVFQCWAIKDCHIKAEISDKEVALFFDQLIDLVAAAYILHQANRVSPNQQEGTDHD